MGCRREFFFFVERKVDYRVCWGEIDRRLPWCCNYSIIISKSIINNYMSKLNFEEKNFDSRKESQVRSQNRKAPILGCRTEFFFFVEKKGYYRVFWGEIYRRLPWCCNHFIIISGSQSKFQKSEFFIVLPTFDRDHEIIM